MISRIKLAYKYLRNGRMDDYLMILAYAKKKEYQIISLDKYVNKQFDQDKKVLILRHDIDHVSKGAEIMFQFEKNLGAYASYYFRQSTVDEKLIKEIHTYGSEASLHFETLSDYAKEKNITTKDELYENDFKQICLTRLKNELTLFREKYSVPCETIASHGEFINRIIATPNNILTEDKSSYDFLKIKMEAYNKYLVDSFDIYISDTIMEINQGYLYGCDPITAINNNNKVILFLTHPNHWYYSSYQRVRKIVKSIVKASVHQEEKFRRI